MTISHIVCLGLVAGASVVTALAADAPKDKITGTAVSRLPVTARQAAGADDEPTLRLNFRNAAVESVLDYLSDAAGFTISLDSPVRGTVDVWNNQPVTKKEALEILDAALDKNGFTSVQNGRVLTIMTKEKAFATIEPVESGLDPESIAKDNRIVTRIMPVAHINAAQLIRELSPILPSLRTMVANEAGNSIIIKDTRANIHHLAEIVKALDTAVSGITSIKVIMLKFADSKATASLIKELFAPDTSRGSTGGPGGNAGPGGLGNFASRLGGGGFGGPGGDTGGGGFGGPGGGGPGGGFSRNGGGGNTGGSSRGSSAARVLAVADDRSNAVIVTAPDDFMPTIEQLVESVDVNVDDPTELKVFHLKNADATEMAELVGNLFPDDSKSNSNNNNSRNGSPFGGVIFGGPGGGGPGGGFGGPGGGGGGGGGNSGGASNESDRAKKQGKVLAVADARTSSLVVTTSHNLMKQIEGLIAGLDADGSRRMHVYTYDLQNADAQQTAQILQELFQSQQNKSTTRGNQNSPLTTRAGQSTTQTSNGNGSGIGGGGAGGGGATAALGGGR